MSRPRILVPEHHSPVPSYGTAGLVALGVFLLYLITLAPTTAMWDASEYITAAYVLGIPHPPANPLFVLLGRVASLVPFGSVAVRVNALAALSSALSAGIWFLIAERALSTWSDVKWTRTVAAVVAAVLAATAFTVWNQSVVNEKVYTVSLAFFAIVSWLTVRWCDDPDGRLADRLLILIAYLIGLGYTNHPAGFLVGPAVATAVIVRRPQTFLRWKLILACVGTLMLGLTPFAFPPIRAAWHPPMNQGEATGCADKIGFRCTFSSTTKVRLMAIINRDQYGKPELTQRQAPFSAQMGMWWLYFKWQWLRDAHNTAPGPQLALAVAFLALGLAGGYTHWKYDRASFWFFGPLVVTVTLALVFYMNFKYGASQAPELADVPREVRDRDYFYLWSFSTWAVWAAMGLAAIWKSLASRLNLPERQRWLAASPVLLFALIPLAGNWTSASRANETATREWAHDLLNSVEPYGVLVTLGDNDTFPLWYAQEVEGIRQDVTVAVTSLLNTDWYARGLRRRKQVPYDEARGPAAYRGMNTPMPTTPVFQITTEQLDAIPEYVDVRTPQLFEFGDIKAVIDPRQLEYGVPTRGDLMVLQLIKDNYGVRPVYVARTAGSYVQSLGLEPYAVIHALATKISTKPVVASADTMEIPGTGHIDMKRTRELWKGFGGPAAIVRRGEWVDRPSVGIPGLYAMTAGVIGEMLRRSGNAAASDSMRAQATAIAAASQLLDMIPQASVPETLLPTGDSARRQPVPIRP